MIHVLEFRAMGCQVTVQIEAESQQQEAVQRVPAVLESIEARLSRFRAGSELMRLNKQAGEWVSVSSMLFEVVRVAQQATQLTDGLFNPLVLPAMLANGYDCSYEKLTLVRTMPSVPAADWRSLELRLSTREIRIPRHSALDLGGIAKGWATAYLADDLSEIGPCLVNIGGDMAARRAPRELPGWPVEIHDPLHDTAFAMVWLKDTSIATSGLDFRRWKTQEGGTYTHLVDPRTGRPAQTDVLSATIIHPHASKAEAYTKALILLGAQDGLNWLRQQQDAIGFVVCHDGTIMANSDFVHLLNERSLS